MKSRKALQVAVSPLTIITQVVGRELLGPRHFPFHPIQERLREAAESWPVGWAGTAALPRSSLLAELRYFTGFSSIYSPFQDCNFLKNWPCVWTGRDWEVEYLAWGTVDFITVTEGRERERKPVCQCCHYSRDNGPYGFCFYCLWNNLHPPWVWL